MYVCMCACMCVCMYVCILSMYSTHFNVYIAVRNIGSQNNLFITEISKIFAFAKIINGYIYIYILIKPNKTH